MGTVNHIVFSTGERYPVLVDDQGMPDFWVTLYVTEALRVRCAASTIENTIRDILHLKLWEEINARDLLAEFSRGEFLGDPDISAIRDHCRLDARSLIKQRKARLTPAGAQLTVAFPVTTRALDVVSGDHFANRLVHIADFLHFTARAMLRRRANFVELGKQIDEMKARLLAQKNKVHKGRGVASDPDLKAPPPAVFDKFMALVHEDSPDNPYKNPGIRFRNAVLFELLYETGMRAGEALALKIQDVDFQAGTVTIVRRHDDPEDRRHRQPVAKTQGRTIPIKTELVRRLRSYLMDVRAHISGANKHPFVFVTHKRGAHSGMPMSNSTFANRILRDAARQFPGLFDEITRHGFRHNFNYRLSKSIDAYNERAKSDPTLTPINEKQETQIRKQLNGWVSDTTAATYNVRFIKEIATKLMLEDMNAQATHINRGK